MVADGQWASTDGTPGPPDQGKIGIENAHFPPYRDVVPYASVPIAVEVRVLWKFASIGPTAEWIPAVAVRWSSAYVCVHVTDSRSYWSEFWIAASAVRRRS